MHRLQEAHPIFGLVSPANQALTEAPQNLPQQGARPPRPGA
jgi:hypothetical protein